MKVEKFWIWKQGNEAPVVLWILAEITNKILYLWIIQKIFYLQISFENFGCNATTMSYCRTSQNPQGISAQFASQKAWSVFRSYLTMDSTLAQSTLLSGVRRKPLWQISSKTLSPKHWKALGAKGKLFHMKISFSSFLSDIPWETISLLIEMVSEVLRNYSSFNYE